MKHPTSRLLHGYWDRLRGMRAAPERGEIEPGEIRNLLSDSLILEIDPACRAATVRLAGTRICALFGRELRGSPLAALWAQPSRGVMPDPWTLVETVSEETVGVVAGLVGTTDRGETIDLELLLLPLRHRGRTQSRMLGSLSPHFIPHWLGLRPIRDLHASSLRVLGQSFAQDRERAGAALLAEIPPPANDVQAVRRGHLMVHRGGRS